MSMTKEDREIITADLWEKMKLLHDQERENLVQEVAESLGERDEWVRGLLGGGAGPGLTTLVTSEVPLGIDFAVDPDEPRTYVQIFPPEGFFYVEGVRSFNRPGEIWVEEVTPDGLHRPMGFDSATYSLDHQDFGDAPVQRHLAYYRAPWGAISPENPLQVTFRAGHLEGRNLRWTLYGIHAVSLDMTGPPIAALPPASDVGE